MAVSRIGPLRLAIVGALLAIGVVSASAAFSAAIARRSPHAALGLWPPSGEVYAREATVQLAYAVSRAGAGVQAIPRDLPRWVADLSLQALAHDPANALAMRNLAFYHDSHGNHDRARMLMRSALAATRRDSGVNLWLTEDYSRRGKEDAALRLYDITIRTDGAAAAMLMSGMARMLEQSSTLPAFERLLATRPPWLDDFWTVVLSRPSNLQNAFTLRQALHSRGVKMVKDHDALLIAKLANSGLFEQAFSLHDAVAGRAAGRQLLVNDSFDQSNAYPPIGWKVVSEGAFGSSIDGDAGALEVTALPEAAGVVAQQLIRAGGGGNLAVEVNYSGAAGEPLLFGVECADPGQPARFKKSIPVPSGQITKTTLGKGCAFAWVSLILPKSTNAAGRDIRVSDISLRRIN